MLKWLSTFQRSFAYQATCWIHLDVNTPSSCLAIDGLPAITLLQDERQSEPMDDFCRLFGVPRWLQQATRLMNGLEISVAADQLQIKQVNHW